MKQEIAKILVDTVNVLKIHSYIHGQIIIEIAGDNNVVNHLTKITKALSKPMADKTPKLLYSVDLSSFSKSKDSEELTQWIYVNGDTKMNTNFLESIEDFYPKKSK